MDTLKARIRMSHPEQNRLLEPGETFRVSDWIAKDLVGRNLATLVQEDKSFSGYEKAVKPPQESSEGSNTPEDFEAPQGPPDGSVELLEQRGSWYYFSDGTKVNGTVDAMRHLGVTRRELDELTDDL